MPATEILIAFLLAASVFAYVPGPSMLYTAAQTLAFGRRAGWLAALGLHLGGYMHVIAAALGLAVMFQIVPTLYLILKIAGAAYLVWLGLGMILRDLPSTADEANTLPSSPPRRRVLWHSMSVEMLNPKTAVFYLAFLPQFTDPAAALPVWGQLLILGWLVNLMFSSADVVSILLADRLAGLFRASRNARRIAQRIGGSVLLALGANLALTRN